MTGKLTRAEAELVLRRAAELEASRQAQNEDSMEAADLERLGQEVGLSTDAVSQALAELQRGQLTPRDASALQRVLGESQVVVGRWVPHKPAEVTAALTSFMNDQLMVARRHQGERTDWVKAPGLFPGLARSLAFADRYSFGPVDQIESWVLPEGEGSQVQFRMEMGAARSQGLSALTWRGLVLSGSGFVFAQGMADLAAAMTCLAAAGGGLALVLLRERRRFAQLRDRVSLAPERFLDALSAAFPRPGRESEEPDLERPLSA